MNTVAKARIDELKSEIKQKLEEIRQLAVENDISTDFQMGWNTYSVLLESDHDEETMDYLINDNDLEIGQWVSSSDLC